MALRRITIDIDTQEPVNGKRRYGLRVVSENGEKITDNLTAGKLHTLVSFAVIEAVESLLLFP